jgi:hypothetical protein
VLNVGFEHSHYVPISPNAGDLSEVVEDAQIDNLNASFGYVCRGIPEHLAWAEAEGASGGRVGIMRGAVCVLPGAGGAGSRSSRQPLVSLGETLVIVDRAFLVAWASSRGPGAYRTSSGECNSLGDVVRIACRQPICWRSSVGTIKEPS